MRARSLDELQVYRKSLTLSVAISAILTRRRLREDLNLCRQMGTASAAVPREYAEGFGQQSDRHFAKYLFIARGSSHEMRAHLVIAHSRSYLEDNELRDTLRQVRRDRQDADKPHQVPGDERPQAARLKGRLTVDFDFRLPTMTLGLPTMTVD